MSSFPSSARIWSFFAVQLSCCPWWLALGWYNMADSVKFSWWVSFMIWKLHHQLVTSLNRIYLQMLVGGFSSINFCPWKRCRRIGAPGYASKYPIKAKKSCLCREIILSRTRVKKSQFKKGHLLYGYIFSY